MSGILYVVATPIGNLEDVTLRALRILREVSLIAAEDTRRTSRLLQHYSISTPTTSLHEHNERARTPHLIARLRRGESVALVSDAGTPGISDPGAELVAAVRAEGIRVEPIPGPSAAVALVSILGGAETGFCFGGFPPSRSTDRKRFLQDLAQSTRPVVLFEAPHRIHALLSDIAGILGDRRVAVGRELTKAHEEFGIRPISDWLNGLPRAQGEFVVAIMPGPPPEIYQANDQDLVVAFTEAAKDPAMSRRAAIRAVAEKFAVSARRVFDAVEAAKKSTG